MLNDDSNENFRCHSHSNLRWPDERCPQDWHTKLFSGNQINSGFGLPDRYRCTDVYINFFLITPVDSFHLAVYHNNISRIHVVRSEEK